MSFLKDLGKKEFKQKSENIKIKEEPFKKEYKQKPKIIIQNYEWIVDEFQQLKTYFRKGKRPSQTTAINNFEKHLNDLIKNI